MCWWGSAWTGERWPLIIALAARPQPFFLLSQHLGCVRRIVSLGVAERFRPLPSLVILGVCMDKQPTRPTCSSNWVAPLSDLRFWRGSQTGGASLLYRFTYWRAWHSEMAASYRFGSPGTLSRVEWRLVFSYSCSCAIR